MEAARKVSGRAKTSPSVPKVSANEAKINDTSEAINGDTTKVPKLQKPLMMKKKVLERLLD